MVWFKVQLANDKAKVPTRADDGAAGYDLYSCEDAVIPPRDQKLVDTGIRVSVSDDTYLRVAPRSGLSLKKIHIGAGVVDASYRGIVKVLMINNSDVEYAVSTGDRIAQAIIERIANPTIEQVDSLDETQRGDGGFGSSGR